MNTPIFKYVFKISKWSECSESHILGKRNYSENEFGDFISQ